MNQKGMTLIEIMIVLVIIGGIMSVLSNKAFDSFTKARVKEAVIQLSQIKGALRSYSLDCGSLPPPSLGLEALLVSPGSEVCKTWGPSPYIEKKQLVDPFGREFLYESDGVKVSIKFLGKDGKPGGTGFDTDINEEEINN